MRAVNLRTEHLENPIGIDRKTPLLSWNCEGSVRQTAYEVEAFCDGAGVFASGKVTSEQMHIFYEKGLESRQRISWRVRLWDENDEVGEWSEAFFEMGILEKNQFTARWINPELECNPEEHKPASYLRTSFETARGKNARLYITCHGLYEAWINGRRVGAFVLAPGSYNYEKKLAYQTYDVTELICDGENRVEVILGDGWYRSVSGVDGDRNLYGTDVALFFQLEVDGKAVCVSDDRWTASQKGPIREDDMQQGEVVDARMEEPTDFHAVKVEDFGVDNLVCSNCVPVCEKERFEGKIFRTPNGETVIDYGQNLAGYIEFTIRAHEGDTIVLTHGETLDENGNFTQENFQDRKRHKEGGTNQRVTYVCKEGENHYKSKFTIWGFRYARVDTEIDLSHAAFTSIAVYSDMRQLGTFSCGNDKVNKLVQNSIWSQKSNFCDVPTDCPTRERAAWTGDMGVFAHTGIYLMDAYSVIDKWLAECRMAQHDDGKVANIAPRNNNPGMFSGLLSGSVGWGDACIIVPYTLYKRDGDIRILEDNYDMMKRWYAFLEKRAKQRPINPVRRFRRNPYRRFTIETGIDYGEWCEPGVDNASVMRTPQSKVATAFFAYSGQMLSEIAEVLGRQEDAERYAKISKNAKKAYRFIATEDGKISSEHQADYVRVIAYDLLDETEKKQAAADLNSLVIKNGYHLNTGFLSTPNLCRVLADYGYVDTAYRLLLQESRPGWLYAIGQGATTIWETWDGINEKGEVRESLNHYSYGAVCGWLFDGVCGIKVQDGRITIAPHPHQSLAYATATYHSPLGTIVSSWRYEGENVVYEITVPANTTARVVLPDGREEVLEAGTHVR